jgi:hypothetical protein
MENFRAMLRIHVKVTRCLRMQAYSSAAGTELIRDQEHEQNKKRTWLYECESTVRNNSSKMGS